jgi:putative PIN family toxin of toxin-antitoxin system
MKIVLDTNILLVSISKKSKFRWIFDAFLNEQFTLCVTTDILLEYEEILSNHMGNAFASVILQLIENAPNVNLITNFYQWKLIQKDPDDDKFIDCVVSGGADYLVTHDKHFNITETIPFPKINVISAEEFQQILES